MIITKRNIHIPIIMNSQNKKQTSFRGQSILQILLPVSIIQLVFPLRLNEKEMISQVFHVYSGFPIILSSVSSFLKGEKRMRTYYSNGRNEQIYNECSYQSMRHGKDLLLSPVQENTELSGWRRLIGQFQVQLGCTCNPAAPVLGRRSRSRRAVRNQ